MLDRKTYLETMVLLCEMVGRKMSDGLIALYYNALSDMSTEEFLAAANRIVRERKFTSLPTPADFLEGSISRTEDRAMIAAEEVLGVMRDQGGDADVQFADPAIMCAVQMAGGWPFLCEYVNSFDLDKLGIWKREFAGLYRASVTRKAQAPRVLLGRHSQENITRGWLNPETGELKNALGQVVRCLPWGTAALVGRAEKLIEEGEGVEALVAKVSAGLKA